MEKCSYFIPEKALFGSFPSQATVDMLEEMGIRYFIDLTEVGEPNVEPYITRYNFIKYPVKDHSYPNDWKTFSQLIIKISDLIKNGNKVYIHCKGGHGRSGILVACILCFMYNLHPNEAIKRTTYYHSKRPVLREKWKKVGSPQGKTQKDFVYKFYRPLFFYKICRASFSIGLHNQSPHPVVIDNYRFPNAFFAFQYFRDPENIAYVKNLQIGKFCPELVKFDESWIKNKNDYMYRVLKTKFLQNPSILKNFLNTGLRPLVKVSFDPYWGNGNGKGYNIQGKLLERLRQEFLSDVNLIVQELSSTNLSSSATTTE
jgi:predicted NAD-dependent protein-ADP-ribosyltransferase YbiA (DUF1768 family)